MYKKKTNFININKFYKYIIYIIKIYPKRYKRHCLRSTGLPLNSNLTVTYSMTRSTQNILDKKKRIEVVPRFYSKYSFQSN